MKTINNPNIYRTYGKLKKKIRAAQGKPATLARLTKKVRSLSRQIENG